MTIGRGIELDVGKLFDSAPERLLPAGMDQIQIAVTNADTAIASDFKRVLFI